MRFTLTIDCDNEAFGERLGEVSSILYSAYVKVGHDGIESDSLRDSNGNTVGRFSFEE